jgi:diacylglycerol kinase family enzyme
MPPSPTTKNPAPKVFLNAGCGNVDAARNALEAAGLELEEIQPAQLGKQLKAAIDNGARRVLVAGGDGTIATAADLVAKSDVELAVLPGGTLNHFARDHGIPTDLGEAAILGRSGRDVVGADIGYVNDQVFLNTSSIGAYVTFVRVRERLEKRFGYKIASALAFTRMLSELRTFGVTLEAAGEKKSYRASMVFVGVGERELKMPALGSRVKNGKRGLHVMIVRGRKPARLFAVALSAIAKGTEETAELPEFDDFIVDTCTVDLSHGSTTIGLDGELKTLKTALDYRLERDAFRLVVSPPDKDQ